MSKYSEPIRTFPIAQNLIIEYCLYARKSTEDDERQAMSIDSQIKEMTEIAVKEGLFIKEIRKESHSAKMSGQRPVFAQLLDDIRSASQDINPDEKTMDIRDYPKHVLSNGVTEKKRQLIGLFSNQLYLHDRKVVSSRANRASG
ncbi:MAG: recombinase family protein [Patescibacteria group bacterium]